MPWIHAIFSNNSRNCSGSRWLISLAREVCRHRAGGRLTRMACNACGQADSPDRHAGVAYAGGVTHRNGMRAPGGDQGTLGCLPRGQWVRVSSVIMHTTLVAESGRRSLRSAERSVCVIQCCNNTFGDRSFAVAGSRVSLRKICLTMDTFCIHLKTVFFTDSWGRGAFMIFWYYRAVYKCPYLLTYLLACYFGEFSTL